MEGSDEGFVDVSEKQDGGVLKKILVEGCGEETPPSGSTVKCHYVGTLYADGTKFDSSRDRPGSFDFEIGLGNVIDGWDQGISTMKRGEKSILRCRSDYAYGEDGSPPDIPENATLDFEVELFSWKEKGKPFWEMSPEERIDFARKCKDEGTEALKAQDWETAVSSYETGAAYVTYEGVLDNDNAGLGDEQRNLAVALYNNCALARLKAGDAQGCTSDCTKALGYDDKNVKAFFRRAQAALALEDLAACAADCSKALEGDPENKEIQQLRRRALDAEKKIKQKEKAVYSKMFG